MTKGTFWTRVRFLVTSFRIGILSFRIGHCSNKALLRINKIKENMSVSITYIKYKNKIPVGDMEMVKVEKMNSGSTLLKKRPHAEPRESFIVLATSRRQERNSTSK